MSTTLDPRLDLRDGSPPLTPQPNGKPQLPPLPRSSPSRASKVPLRMLFAASLVLVPTMFWVIRPEFGQTDQRLVFHQIKRKDLSITVTEKGNLESQQVTEIRCQVQNFGNDRNGNNGTQILQIVPNGQMVQKGELIVELDSGPLRERIDNQVIAFERARERYEQASVKFENQKTLNETALAGAQLRLELAQLELKMYEDGQDGTYQIALKELELRIQEAKNRIREAEAGLLMQRSNRNGVQTLYKLGYRGEGDLDQAMFRYLQAEDELVKATNSLASAISNRRKLELYEHPMRRLELEGAMNTARRRLIQVLRDNEASIAHSLSAKNSSGRELEKQKERLDRYRAQRKNCKIYAPHAGMIVYPNKRGRYGAGQDIIGEGTFVRQRQRILTLPDLTRMRVQTAVHEAVLDQVEEGLAATIRVDAFPDRVYHGTVRTVAVLPDQSGWLSSDVKIYETIVTIDQKVQQLKPGMTAVVEIHVAELRDVLSLPVQAVVQTGLENVCYVRTPAGIERRIVKLGRTNDKFVEIRDGIDDGEYVVLNPTDIPDPSAEQKRSHRPEEKHQQLAWESESQGAGQHRAL